MPEKTLSVSETFLDGRRVFVNESLRLNTDGRRLVSISGPFDPILALKRVMGSNWRVSAILETWYILPKKEPEVYQLGELPVWRVCSTAPACIEVMYVLSEENFVIPALIDLGLTIEQSRALRDVGFRAYRFEELIPS